MVPLHPFGRKIPNDLPWVDLDTPIFCAMDRHGGWSYHQLVRIIHQQWKQVHARKLFLSSGFFNRARGYWWLPVGPHKAVAEISKIGNYRRGELSWCMDGRVNPLMGRKVLEGLSLSFSLLVSCSSLSNCLYLSLSVWRHSEDIPSLQTLPMAFNLYRSNVLLRPDVADGGAYSRPAEAQNIGKNMKQSFAIFPPFRVRWSYVGYLFLFWLFLFSKCSRLCCFMCPYCRKFDF